MDSRQIEEADCRGVKISLKERLEVRAPRLKSGDG